MARLTLTVHIFLFLSVQSQKVGWGVGILFAVIGLTAKTVYMYNFSILPQKERRQKGFYDYRKSYLTERPNPEGKIDC